MQGLVEGRHATGENAFRVTQMTSKFKLGDAKSDSDDEVNEVKCSSLGITPDNSFEIDEGQSFEKPFSDWVCTYHFQYIILNNIFYRVLVPLRHLKSSP